MIAHEFRELVLAACEEHRGVCPKHFHQGYKYRLITFMDLLEAVTNLVDSLNYRRSQTELQHLLINAMEVEQSVFDRAEIQAIHCIMHADDVGEAL
ncbi:hypothetical protein FACS189472_18240 [Alphaproteobacteria bacterium]|nr:hypothetical protein FACS189472_18240 [Alphaproteobacteria bacterium]